MILLRTLEEILNKLVQLKPPREGCVRVFRGQARPYEKMLATEFRKRVRRSHMWAVAIANNLRDVGGDPNLPDSGLVWIPAILQHYGPGTAYLDVTHSIEVAIWFALYEPHFHIEHGGTEWPQTVSVESSFCTYSRSEAECGWLYVFDVPAGDPRKPYGGTLIDLRVDAPTEFASSGRVQKQEACLITCPSDNADADLCHLFACDPIPVSWPMADAELLSKGVSSLFPYPSADHWYDRLLRMPSFCQLDRDKASVVVRHALDITCYYECDRDIDQYMKTFRLYAPTPFGAFLSEYEDERVVQSRVQESIRTSVRDSYQILVESPILSSLPPIELWNESLLAEDVPLAIELRKPSQTVNLRSVFIEFSPLEYSSAEFQNIAGCNGEVLRAAHVYRKDHFSYKFSLFVQNLSGHAITSTPWFRTYFSERLARFMFECKELGIKDCLLADYPCFAKPFFGCLQILRELSPELKAAPFPSLYGKVPGKGYVAETLVARDLASLVCTECPGLKFQLNFLVDKDGDPLCTNRHAERHLFLKSVLPYSQLDGKLLSRIVHGSETKDEVIQAFIDRYEWVEGSSDEASTAAKVVKVFSSLLKQ